MHRDSVRLPLTVDLPVVVPVKVHKQLVRFSLAELDAEIFQPFPENDMKFPKGNEMEGKGKSDQQKGQEEIWEKHAR